MLWVLKRTVSMLNWTLPVSAHMIIMQSLWKACPKSFLLFKLDMVLHIGKLVWARSVDDRHNLNDDISETVLISSFFLAVFLTNSRVITLKRV